jgi:hypothetical protein
MNGSELIRAFEFDDYTTLDQQVHSLAVDTQIFELIAALPRPTRILATLTRVAMPFDTHFPGILVQGCDALRKQPQ